MRLTLTIQELKDPETSVLFKAVSGSLDVTMPNERGKARSRRINFMTTTKEVAGLDRIVEGLVTSALALDKQSRESKAKGDPNGAIKIPNRRESRDKK